MAIEIGCYYFPNYHTGDPLNEKYHGHGWSEWELVKTAKQRFPGHCQPNLPLWGYTDEKQPAVMAQKINAAADNGIDSFIFDWYYYDNEGPFLNRALEEGFLHAPNRKRLKFCTMWANHDWRDLHPCTRYGGRNILMPGRVTHDTFEKIARIHIDRYFSHSNYLTFDGKPYFSIYDLNTLLASFGSVKETRTVLDGFRKECLAAGLPGLHLNAVVWNNPVLPGEDVPVDLPHLIGELGFDSITSYVWIHHVKLDKHEKPFDEVFAEYLSYWENVLKTFRIEYFPNVSMGWDSSPRTVQSEAWDWSPDLRYPFGNIITDNTPERFHSALDTVLNRLTQLNQKHEFMNINSWNEWTEGSYIEPDQKNGYAYLEAIRTVKNGESRNRMRNRQDEK